MRKPFLSQKAISEFKAIYQAETNEAISDDEAEEMGLDVLNLFKILLEPDP